MCDDYYTKIKYMLKSHNIKIKEKKNIIKRFLSSDYDNNLRLCWFLTMLITTLNDEQLTDMFGEGYKTSKLGEGYRRGVKGICYFFKLNGITSHFFIDNRGVKLEYEAITDKNALFQYMSDVYELIITKTNQSKDIVDAYKDLL